MIFRYPRDRSRSLARPGFRVNRASFFLAILAICFVRANITSKQPRLRAHIVASGNCVEFPTVDLMLLQSGSNNAAMKSILGIVIALCVGGAFAFAYWLSARPGASWLDGQWLFLVALPYNWASLHVLGDASFSPDATAYGGGRLCFRRCRGVPCRRDHRSFGAMALAAYVSAAKPSMSSRFCTAAPEAPLPRLSNFAISTACRRFSLANT